MLLVLLIFYFSVGKNSRLAKRDAYMKKILSDYAAKRVLRDEYRKILHNARSADNLYNEPPDPDCIGLACMKGWSDDRYDEPPEPDCIGLACMGGW